MEGRRAERQVLRGTRILTTIYGLATLTSLFLALLLRFTERHPTLLETFFGLLNVPVARSWVSVVVLALATRALLGRKRFALWLVAIFQAYAAFLGIIALLHFARMPILVPWSAHTEVGRVFDVISLGVAVFALWWLWHIRSAFPGRLVPGSWLRAILAVIVGGVTTLAVTWLCLMLVHKDVTPRGLVVAVLAALGDPDSVRHGRFAAVPGWLLDVTAILLSLTIIAAVALFLGAARHRTRWSGARELQIRRLLAAYGESDSLGYFATRRDKDSMFSRDDQAVVLYRVTGGVSLASGDPVGRPESWGSAVASWLAEARDYGWLPTVLGASEEGAKAYAAAGLSVIAMGDEAILDPARFDLRRTSMSPVRHAVQRAARAGLTVTFHRQEDLPPAELREILEKAEQWRGDEPERGFSMALNREADPADGRILFATARDPEGHLAGLLSFVPWGRSGVSLDLMRRAPDAPNGVTELLVARVMEAAPELGIRRVSLNFCMFRSIFEDATRVGAGSITRFNASVLGFFDRFWQLERLYRSNAKFEPQWYPRFICYQDVMSIPHAAIASGSAEGFLPAPPFARFSGSPNGRLSDAELAEVAALVAAPVTDVDQVGPRRSDQTRHRLAHLGAMAAAGLDGYPVTAADAPTPVAALPTDWPYAARLHVVGRIRRIRDHGGVVFVTLCDGGIGIQLLLDAATLTRDRVREFAHLADRGDLLRADGRPGRSRTGTDSLLVDSWTIEAKALHPIPFDAFNDPESRLRQRSTDLIVHPGQAALLRQRSLVVRAIRTTLDAAGFLEVETPMLHTIHGGATARPFTTYINAYGLDLSLRIAPELYLKRLLVGGMGPIYELGRNFRNEGADATHNPEFTSLEVYQPYADYTDMRHLTEALVKAAATAVHGVPSLPLPGPDRVRIGLDGVPLVDVGGEWAVVPVLDAVSRATGRDIGLDTDMDVLLGLAREHGIAVRDDMGPGALIEELYADLVEPVTLTPTFFVDFPVETSPLTRPHRSKPGLVERWDLVIAGMEVATAYTELTDPIDQRRRLTAQSLKAAAGDPEAMEVDEDFLFALETGMPPTGGLGVGIDRLVMLVTNTSIRSVLTFPFVKPRA